MCKMHTMFQNCESTDHMRELDLLDVSNACRVTRIKQKFMPEQQEVLLGLMIIVKGFL